MIFGTDGIRSRFGVAPLDQATIEQLSLVIAQWLKTPGTIVIGSDTRASCAAIRQWILSYLGAHRVLDLGVVPTPVVAFETRASAAQLGIMITASHNPAHDNGLKFFGPDGLKIQQGTAEAWSTALEERQPSAPFHHAALIPTQPVHYTAFIKKTFSPADFKDLRVAFDLAHGAGTSLIPFLCHELGLNAHFLGCAPNGNNINDQVGALHPSALASFVGTNGYTLGFALDGDGDRLIVTAPEELPGDLILFALTLNLIHEGKKPSAVVGTIMCGMGLERAFAELGITLIRTQVGDQHVMDEMVAHGHLLGGEPSGHLIQADLFPAGDGFLAALRLARGLAQNPNLLDRALSEVLLYETFEKAYPVVRKPALESLPRLSAAVEELRQTLGDHGRLIIRYSGTEPKLRLYVEASDLTPVQPQIDNVVSAIREELS